ncbi:glycosyltransferase family 22 protein [Pholiota conissans]|uniref:Mannosyltransferase n=1 Tax=Pholiota conissans TaxID=109636 RepID=A0A9P5ZAZ1_9AGAR|nr:glycosyltransferase family 22 protein [Pholiota conissans]
MDLRIVQLALSIRITIALLTRTFFQPDEYFQSLEPAHHIVFGYGHLTWEWMAPQPIRSIIYPAINIPVYYFLKLSGLSETWKIGDILLIACPKILHGCLAACTDIFMGKIARSVLGSDYISTAVFLSLTSFFNAIALSRSLSNSLETSLTVIAFAYYPWDASSKLSPQLIFNRYFNSFSIYVKLIIFSALACIIRSTNAVIWLYLYANLLWSVRQHRRILYIFAREISLSASLAILFMLAIDSLYYNKLTLIPLNFLKTNLSSVSLFYGTNPWHYYISQAIPILLTTALPFTLHGIWATITSKSPRNTPLKTMLATIIWTVAIYSLAGHKEWRFLHPTLPLLYIFATKSIVDSFRLKLPRKQNLPKKYLGFLLATAPVSAYVILFYCSAPISVMSYIRSIPKGQLNQTTIGVLMPCHSIPGHAYIHRELLAHGRMWALGCEPPLEHQDLSTYKDQTNVFYASPVSYLQKYFPKHVNINFPFSEYPATLPGASSSPLIVDSFGKIAYPWKHEWPTHLIFFGDLLREEGILDTLGMQGYQEVWKAGREWEGEGKRKGGVRVWKWSQ